MRSFVLITLIWIIPGLADAQSRKILSLQECYNHAAEASALAKEKETFTEIWQLKDRNLSRGWLPTLDASGSFVYNSEVIDIGNSLGALPFPGIADAIKPLPHEQYKAGIDINQMIYDGGTIRGARVLEKADLLINEKQNETDLYKLRNQINDCYFNLLLLDRQKDLLEIFLELVNKRIISMQSAAANGVILRSDIDVMSSEKLKLEQQINENGIRRVSLLKILSDLTGTEIGPSSELVMPLFPEEVSEGISRPELEIFDLRKEQLDASLNLINSRKIPKAYGFATLGYGNPPGNNFFRDEFAPYYVVGAGIKWNIFDWNKARDEKKIIGLQQEMIQNRKNDLADNLSRLLEAKKAEISNLESLIGTDEKIIRLRKNITAAAESQYENGIITATELLNEINSEKQALINHEMHKINLAMARVEYLNICGKEIE